MERLGFLLALGLFVGCSAPSPYAADPWHSRIRECGSVILVQCDRTAAW